MSRNVVLLWAALAIAAPSRSADAQDQDLLPSWNDTAAKFRIVDFVERVTDDDGDDFVPVEDRIAVFDNDGTLWCEKPTVQAAFTKQRAIRLWRSHPQWRNQEVFKGVRDDPAFLNNPDEARQFRILAATHNDMSQDRFRQIVRSFFRTAKHPQYKVGFKELAYQPMLELLDYLRAHEFETWICSGGGVHFMRVISKDVYGIPPQQVIGSSARMEFREVDGEWELFRPLDENVTIDEVLVNNKETKPINIELHIGRPPIFAAGNVKSGGDVAMLRHCQQTDGPSLQLMVNHDDEKREFAYEEEDRASLNAAEQNEWTVISIRDDWRRVFAHEEDGESADR